MAPDSEHEKAQKMGCILPFTQNPFSPCPSYISKEVTTKWLKSGDLEFVWGLTCVSCARVEQRVCVGDKLQLSVQVEQDAARQGHVHLAVTFDFHAVYLRCHIQRSQRGSDVYLQRDGEKSQWDKRTADICIVSM